MKLPISKEQSGNRRSWGMSYADSPYIETPKNHSRIESEMWTTASIIVRKAKNLW